MAEFGINPTGEEVPEADRIEQAIPADPEAVSDDPETTIIPGELASEVEVVDPADLVDPADRLEQAMAVDDDEDDYPRG
ncbi:MAG: hypothetical protein QOH56_3895 [Pseudonocardiales bacterium]|jgi:hypothetical protein|nr:hypothetical protein [Pseudonocardiales bacterium]